MLSPVHEAASKRNGEEAVSGRPTNYTIKIQARVASGIGDDRNGAISIERYPFFFPRTYF